MPCSCPAGEDRCPGCPRTATCKHWTPSNSSKFHNCGDRNQWGICKRPKTDCPNCPFFKPPSDLRGRPRIVDEFDRMEVDDPFWNDPRTWGEKVDPAESKRASDKRYKERRRELDPDYGKNSPEYMKEYMRDYRAAKRAAKRSTNGKISKE